MKNKNSTLKDKDLNGVTGGVQNDKKKKKIINKISEIKDNDLADINGGIDITAQGAKKTPLVQSLAKKKVPKKTLSKLTEIDNIACLSFEEKLRLARSISDTDASVGDMDEDSLTALLENKFKGLI